MIPNYRRRIFKMAKSLHNVLCDYHRHDTKAYEVFSRFGLPYTIVSDSGTQLTSTQFDEFHRENSIAHVWFPL